MIVNTAEEAFKIYEKGHSNIIISDCKDVWYRDLFLSLSLKYLNQLGMSLFDQVIHYDDWHNGIHIPIPKGIKDQPNQKILLSKLNLTGRKDIKTETARSVTQFVKEVVKQITHTYSYVQFDLYKNTMFKVPPDALIDLHAFLRHVYIPLSPEEEAVGTEANPNRNYKKSSLVVLFVDDISYYKSLEDTVIFLTDVTVDASSTDKFVDNIFKPIAGVTPLEVANVKSDLRLISTTNFWALNNELRIVSRPDKKDKNKLVYLKEDVLRLVKKFTEDHYYSGLLDRLPAERDFSHIADMEFVKNYISENIADVWLNADIANKYDIPIEKGILLYGMPGTGKTFITQSLGKELNLPVYSFDFAKIASKWVGETENKLRMLLNFVDKVSPCVLFIDELESTTFDRGNTHTNTSYMNVVNMLLQYIGNPNRNNIIVGATNLIENIDPAMLRKGRFSSILYVELPDLKERQSIFQHLIGKIPVASDINYGQLALLTQNFSRAEINDVVSVTKRRVLLKERATKLTTAQFEVTIKDVKLPDNRNDMIKQYNSLAYFYGAIMEPKDTRELATKPVGNTLKMTKPDIKIIPGDSSLN